MTMIGKTRWYFGVKDLPLVSSLKLYVYCQKLVLTIAFGLATWNAAIASFLVEFLEKEPNAISQSTSVSDLFKILILNPLKVVIPSNGSVVIVIDAVDGTLGQ